MSDGQRRPSTREDARQMRSLWLAATLLLASGSLGAQEPTRSFVDRLGERLPTTEAGRVHASVESARARGLPADVLENMALELTAKGAPAGAVIARVERRLELLSNARAVIRDARGAEPASDEIAAGVEAMQRGVKGSEIAEVARSAATGRSLAVPLLVLSELLDRGLPSDAALERVRARLLARAADVDLQRELTGPRIVQPPAGRGVGVVRGGIADDRGSRPVSLPRGRQPQRTRRGG